MNIEELKVQVRLWAASEPLVNKAYIFGSRYRGSHHKNSDLDLAIEIIKMPNDSGPYATFSFEKTNLLASIAKRVPYLIDLQWYGGAIETPTIRKGILQSSELVFCNTLIATVDS